ncbi:MAG: methionyl-tRNA formyltransferase [Wenzhouxiangellaceae bacterium]|nr:methionyl-tRNA formyltransferase [Wenzhouxiangellaceae bacterium]
MALPRIVFAGTPAFACPALQVVLRHTRPAAVLTQPDRPAGRGRKLQASPVKQLARAHDIPVLQPASLREPAAQAALAAVEPGLIITAAYGLLLPRAVLEGPAHGCWNLHASLLPRWRGASPIQQAILAGDFETGVSLMQLDAGMDTGPVRMTEATAIGEHETAGELHDRLADIAAELLDRALTLLATGHLPEARPQDDAHATRAPRIQRDDARIDWQQPALQLDRQVRAYQPWPIAWGELAGHDVRIHQARPVAAVAGVASGQIDPQAAAARTLVVACGDGALAIERLQEPGRRPVTGADWLNAHPDASLRHA